MKERKTNYAELAQSGEQVPYKHQVGSSSLSRRTINIALLSEMKPEHSIMGS